MTALTSEPPRHSRVGGPRALHPALPLTNRQRGAGYTCRLVPPFPTANGDSTDFIRDVGEWSEFI